MKLKITALLALVALAVLGLVAPSPAAADGDDIGQPTATRIGSFGGIAYVQYDGIFQGRTSTGAFRVPYEITAPANPDKGNGTVLVEPPHFVEGLGARDTKLGPDFLFSRGFAHAGVGWSTDLNDDGTLTLNILDPSVPGVFIKGGVDEFGGKMDAEIITDFARALVNDSTARKMLGHIDRRYLIGFSDSSDPIMRLIQSGRASGIFDLVIPFTVSSSDWLSGIGYDPQTVIQRGKFDGKLILLNSDAEGTSGSFVDRGRSSNQYRFYAAAGTPHLPDPLVAGPPSNHTTPASYLPELRAHFLQGDSWVRRGTPPPASNHFKSSDGTNLDLDANGNPITVNAQGRRVPRLPFVELGEATYGLDADNFLGTLDNVKSIKQLGFKKHDHYVNAFADALSDYSDAGYILPDDAHDMLQRANLCASLTYTQTYQKHYNNFTAITPCGN